MDLHCARAPKQPVWALALDALKGRSVQLTTLQQNRDWPAVLDIARAAAERGGTAFVVGGAARDANAGERVEDLDIEVFGVEPDGVATMLGRLGLAYDTVGQSFAVVKLKGLAVDVSLPRRERKVGDRHQDFIVEADSSMSVREAAARRDFTVNAMMLDPLTRTLHDPFGGKRDLRDGVLRHTSARFVEDPLRVLRGMQFAARFGLKPTKELIALCRTLDWKNLSRERVFGEWAKMILKGVKIGSGLRFLEATGWLSSCPELEALVGCPQQPEWHPEGDAWTHTQHVMDAFAAERIGDPDEDLVVGLACLCHDIGKPAVTRREDGNWITRGHEEAGVEPTRKLLARWTNSRPLVEDVVRLVIDHMKPAMLHRAGARKTAVRRLASRVGRIDRLARVAHADQSGRPPKTPDLRCCDWLLEVAANLKMKSSGPDPIVMGRDVVARGIAPGPEVGRLLAVCFDAQLDGEFDTHDGGLEFLDRLLDTHKGESA